MSAIFVLLLMVMVAPATMAQMSFGIKGGLNIADLKDLEGLDSVESVTTESETGFIGGAYVNFPMGPFKLQVEGLYSLKGATSDNNLSNKITELKLTYFEVPLLLKYELPMPAIKPFIYGGGSMAFLMSAEERDVIVNSDWIDIKEGMEDIDYGLVVGGGIQVFTISLDVRYTHGLANTLADVPDGSLVQEAKNRTFSIMAGIKFF